jgi:FixJ family two-component response regulator
VRTILVLDDSEDLLQLTSLVVEHMCGCKAVTAKSMGDVQRLGDTALACHLAILDINLGPGEPSGVDVYRWLRDRGFRHPIYFLTGHAATFPLVAEAERLGDAKVLNKPMPAAELVRLVKGALND